VHASTGAAPDGRRKAVFHHHSKEPSDSPIVSPKVRTVRLLKDPEELQAAVERAQAFERRRADEYKRRVGAYDRFLTPPETKSAVVVPIESSAS
jgi:hypothetical protein